MQHHKPVETGTMGISYNKSFENKQGQVYYCKMCILTILL